MPATTLDRFTPTAIALVSRAWVVEVVEQRVADPARRAALIEELIGYEPPRRHGLRNMFFFWLAALSASALAGAIGLPRWWGFVVVIVAFLAVARSLATRALLWRLDQLLSQDEASGNT